MAAQKKVAVPQGGWQAAKGIKGTPPVESKSKKRAPALDFNHDEVNNRKLVWRLAWLDEGGPWAPTRIEPAQMAVLMRKMVAYESMTIGEIFAPGSEHGKAYDVSELPSAASKRISEIKRDDEALIHRLRCSAKRRLYGILREHVFHVLWWDPEHTVWPSKKRNT